MILDRIIWTAGDIVRGRQRITCAGCGAKSRNFVGTAAHNEKCWERYLILPPRVVYLCTGCNALFRSGAEVTLDGGSTMQLGPNDAR